MGVEKRLSELQGGFRAKVERMLKVIGKEWAPLNRVPIVVETRRELAVQMAYFSRGRMKPEEVQKMFAAAGLWAIGTTDAAKPVTWTLASKHLEGRAVDIVPSLPNSPKVPDWTAPGVVWKVIGAAAKAEGLQWGGDWKDRMDAPHVEDV